MPLLDPARAFLLLIDFQTRLMPAIHQGEVTARNAGRLIEMAEMIGVPRLTTEQNAKGLGPTVPELPVEAGGPVHKQAFDVSRVAGVLDRIPTDAQVITLGWEAHVCVLQTVLGLIAAGHETYVVQDAIGSRHPENKEAALRRMDRHGAGIVTTEMVVFEWLGTAEHPQFRQGAALIR